MTDCKPVEAGSIPAGALGNERPWSEFEESGIRYAHIPLVLIISFPLSMMKARKCGTKIRPSSMNPHPGPLSSVDEQRFPKPYDAGSNPVEDLSLVHSVAKDASLSRRSQEFESPTRGLERRWVNQTALLDPFRRTVSRPCKMSRRGKPLDAGD